MIGSEGNAWPVLKRVLQEAAIAKCAEMIGGCDWTVEASASYAKERVQYGHPIGAYGSIQHYLADMWVDILGTRNLVMKAAWKLATDQPADKEVGMASARAGEMGRKTTTVGHRIFGAIGFTMEHDLHLYHRRTVAADLAYGDSDFHYEQVARTLGL